MGKEGLSNLYHTWSNEIPATIIHSTSRPNRFKVRGNWFQGVIAELEDSLEKGEVPHELVPEVNDFMDTYSARSFASEITRPEDIQRANGLIERVIGLESR